MKPALVVFCFFLVGCNNTPQQGGSGEFYTWVDERGQLHTQSRETQVNKVGVNEKVTSGNISSNVKTINEKGVKYPAKLSASAMDIDATQFASSSDVDKKLSGKKLYSWNLDGQQLTAELSPEDVVLLEKESSFNNKASFMYPVILKEYREGKEVLLTDIISNEINLADLYILNKSNNLDYILIEIDTPVDQLIFYSYIKNKKVALPALRFLNKSFNGTQAYSDLLSELTPESWSSYGYLSGRAAIPVDVKYILIQPSSLSGVIETTSGDVVLSNLGSFLISQ
jgi:hypothetical protein